MTITFILKGTLEALPPMLPRLILFAQKGINTNFICSNMTDFNSEMLSSAGVKCVQTLHNTKLLGRESRILDWTGFRKRVKKLVRGKFRESDMLYLCSADTALCLGSVISGYKFILQSNELYDKLPIYKDGLKKYMRNAEYTVMPEYCRANICSYWYDLKREPFIIPNIPFMQSNEKKREIIDTAAKETVSKLEDRKIVIYQGHISSGDRSLNIIAEALSKINDSSFAFLLMGRDHDGSFEKLKKIYSETYFIPFVPAPDHLNVTSHAYIGILSYDRVSLNNLFCAPNKIFEYSGNGVPMIGNDIPGLKYSVEYNKIGKCADYDNVDSVVSAIKAIDSDYEFYSRNSYDYYKQNSLELLIDNFISAVKNEENC